MSNNPSTQQRSFGEFYNMQTVLHTHMHAEHSQHNKDERTQFFIKNIPLTFFESGYERVTVCDVSWRLKKYCNILTPNSSGYSSISFPFSWAAQPGARGPSLCWVWFSLLELEHWLQTLISNWLTSCRTRVISLFNIHLHPVASQFALNSTVDSQGYPLISSTGCTCENGKFL